MRSTILKLALAGACALSTLPMACSADIHDNTAEVRDNTVNIKDARVEFTTSIDRQNVQSGQAVPFTVVAQDVFLIEPSQVPPPDRAMVAGHFRFYFDSTESEPILITAQTNVMVTVPADATPGDHKVICRVHKHDGTPTTATFELSVKVTAKVI